MAADFATMLYGTAQNAEQNSAVGQLPDAIQQGASLALKKQQIDQAQQQMQVQMQQVQQAKIDKSMDWFEKAASMPEGSIKNAFIKNYIPNGINAMGLTDVFHPDSLAMAQSDPSLAAFLNQKAKTDPAAYPMMLKALRDPETMATMAASDDFKIYGGQQEIKEAIQNSIGQLSKSADVSNENAFKDKELQARMDTNKELALARIQAGQGKTSNAEENKLATEIRSKFEPLSKDQTALASAQDARDRILTALKKDPSGRTVSPQDMGAMVYSLLHSELGRVNRTELADQLHIPGIENMAEDQLVKFMGGVNPNVVTGLIQRVNTAAQELDARKARLSKAYAPQIDGKPKAAETLKAYQDPVFRSSPDTAPTVSVNGKAYDRAKVEALLQQHPDDPMAGAFRKALGGG